MKAMKLSVFVIIVFVGIFIAATIMAAEVPPPTKKPDLKKAVELQTFVLNKVSSYTPKNCANIAGWDWLRAPNAEVTVEFDTKELEGCDPHFIYLNFTGLCTNKANGGSGFKAVLKCTVQAGDKTQVCTVNAINLFMQKFFVGNKKT